MNKHTPGPWTIPQGPYSPRPNVYKEVQQITEGDLQIAQVNISSESFKVLREECLANAKLIAAAPDLLSACYRARAVALDENWQGAGSLRCNALEDLDKAIFKAEGRE